MPGPLAMCLTPVGAPVCTKVGTDLVLPSAIALGTALAYVASKIDRNQPLVFPVVEKYPLTVLKSGNEEAAVEGEEPNSSETPIQNEDGEWIDSEGRSYFPDAYEAGFQLGDRDDLIDDPDERERYIESERESVASEHEGEAGALGEFDRGFRDGLDAARDARDQGNPGWLEDNPSSPGEPEGWPDRANDLWRPDGK